MHKLILFAVYDSKVEAFDRPFTMYTVGEAERGFRDVVNKEGTQMYAYPEDFTLFALGEIDLEKGVITPYEAKRSVGNGLDFKIKSGLQHKTPKRSGKVRAIHAQ